MYLSVTYFTVKVLTFHLYTFRKSGIFERKLLIKKQELKKRKMTRNRNRKKITIRHRPKKEKL
jgi:hypothetical protein